MQYYKTYARNIGNVFRLNGLASEHANGDPLAAKQHLVSARRLIPNQLLVEEARRDAPIRFWIRNHVGFGHKSVQKELEKYERRVDDMIAGKKKRFYLIK